MFRYFYFIMASNAKVSILRTSCFIMFSNIRLVYIMFRNSEVTQFISEDSNATGTWQAGRGFPSPGVVFLNSFSPNSCSIPSTFNDVVNCYLFCVAMCYRTIPEVHTHCKLNDGYNHGYCAWDSPLSSHRTFGMCSSSDLQRATSGQQWGKSSAHHVSANISSNLYLERGWLVNRNMKS